jgi:putative FmdB family regulatory protein
MPTYEYACKSCGEHLEVVQSFSDDALTTCPRCEGPLRKVFGNIGITFKGSGFYKTDSRSKTAKTGSSPSSESGSSPSSSGSSPSETGSGPSPSSSDSGSSPGSSGGSSSTSSTSAAAS